MDSNLLVELLLRYRVIEDAGGRQWGVVDPRGWVAGRAWQERDRDGAPGWRACWFPASTSAWKGRDLREWYEHRDHALWALAREFRRQGRL